MPPLALVSFPAHQDSDLHPLNISRPQTPPGISALTHDVDEEDTQQAPAMCDNHDGAEEGDWDDDIGWDEEDDMPEIGQDKPNGQPKRTHGARLIAVEGAVGVLGEKVEKQGQVLVAVDTRTAQILAALEKGTIQQGAVEKTPALPAPATPQAGGQYAVLAHLLNTLGPWGVVVYLIIAKGL